MPGSTTVLALPYPLATEPVSQGDDAIKALADRVEALYGVGVAWTAYTPNGSGISGATFTGRYTKIGKTVHFKARAVLNTGFALSTSIALSLPVTASSTMSSHALVNGMFTDVGTANYIAATAINTGSVIGYAFGNSGVFVSTSMTVPFTWAVGDTIDYSGTYEAA